jgi:preprotein translocase subunit SecY
LLRSILNAFKSPDLRKKIAFTFAILAIYRLGTYVPVPGVDPGGIGDAISSQGAANVLQFLNLFSGGALTRFSVFALGIMPYITASIVIQLMTVVIPTLEKLQKEGEAGYAKITQYTRYLTVVLAFLQSLAYVLFFRQQGALDGLSFGRLYLVVISLTAGTVLVMWLGELITQRGIGNGISLMIFASIVAGIPRGIELWWELDPVTKIIIGIMAIAVVIGVVFVNEGQRRIPIQYAKRVVGRRMTQGGTTYMPLRVNMAGVIPVIFAASIVILPSLFSTLIGGGDGFFADLANLLGTNSWFFIIFQALLIILFTYFYTAVQFNPVDQAENLKKYGGFIPGVRPGRPTAVYLDRVMTRLTLPGALYLAVIASIPSVVFKYMPEVNFTFAGTSLLIVVGVAIDTMRQLEAQLMQRQYEGFLK